MSARTSKTQNGDLIVTGDLTVLGGINSATTSKTKATAESSTVETVKVAGDMTVVQEELADISSDNVLSPSDKIIAKGKWTDIQAEEPYVLTQAATRGFGVGDTEYDNYLSAYDDLDDYITPLLADMESPSAIDGDTFRGYFNAYYEARQALFSAEDQVGDIQSDATTTGGAPRFKFSLLNGDITVLNDDDEEIFAFDASAQSLTVRGTIYADAGEFAGELNGAYGRLGVVESALWGSAIGETPISWPAGTTQSTIVTWWRTYGVDAGVLLPVEGICGAYAIKAVTRDSADSSIVYIFHRGGTTTLTGASGTSVSITFTKIYDSVAMYGSGYPAVRDWLSWGYTQYPWRSIAAKSFILVYAYDGHASYKRGDIAIGSDGVVDLDAPLSLSGAARSRATRSTAQTITTATSTTVVFPNQTYDNLGEYDTGTAKFTATHAGYYLVIGSVAFSSVSWPVGTYAHLTLVKNSSGISRLGFEQIDATGTRYVHLAGSDMIYLDANDAVSLEVYHTRGSDTDLLNSSAYNYFAVHRVS